MVRYPSKKALKECVGERLKYMETSMFGPEYKSDGMLVVANRPHLTREFFAEVCMRDGLIASVK
jgi:hypothetical protein